MAERPKTNPEYKEIKKKNTEREVEILKCSTICTKH